MFVSLVRVCDSVNWIGGSVSWIGGSVRICGSVSCIGAAGMSVRRSLGMMVKGMSVCGYFAMFLHRSTHIEKKARICCFLMKYMTKSLHIASLVLYPVDFVNKSS